MLEDLHQIDWKAIGEPSIPDCLWGLVHGKVAVYQQLEKRFVYLGSYSWESYGPASELLSNEAAILIVPFLIELLGFAECKSRGFILELLLDLSSYAELGSASAFVYRKRTKAELDSLLQISPEDGVYTVRGKRVVSEVRKGVEIYKTFLHGHGPDHGMAAAQLLEALGELD